MFEKFCTNCNKVTARIPSMSEDCIQCGFSEDQVKQEETIPNWSFIEED